MAGWCCDCSISCSCVDDDSWCYNCTYCENCECICAEVTSISGISGPYCKGASTNVTANLSHSLPTGCSITWGGDATFSNISGTTATATFNIVGLGKKITAKTSCQSTAKQSSSFTVVEVASVSANKTTACVGEVVEFTANANPSGSPLSCIAWEKRYRPNSSLSWGDWIQTGGGYYNWTILSTTTAGLYQYRARNGSGDTWKESSEVTIVAVASVSVNTTTACVGEAVTFTANSNPSGKPLSCIVWQKRYRQNSSSGWDSWGSANGGDNTAILSTTTAGLYQYRAQNGSADTWKESSEVTIVRVDKVIKAGTTNEGPLYIKETSVPLEALPDPSEASFPPGEPTWTILSQPDGASAFFSQSSGPSTTLENLTKSGIYNIKAQCGNSYDIMSIVLVDVDILYCYSSIVMYTGDHAGDSPTQNCVAHGDPEGGTYSWQCSTTGTGMLGIVSGQNTDTVTVKGTAPSSSAGDAKITVGYTLGGCTVQKTASVTVRRPAITGSYRGEFYWGAVAWRNYFHPIGDQFNVYINLTGMPCDEEVKCIYGQDTDVTSPGSTGYWPAEEAPVYPYANWPGGVAVKDILGCPTLQMPSSKYEQNIYVGGYLTGTYEIYMQPLESQPWPCIWKNP